MSKTPPGVPGSAADYKNRGIPVTKPVTIDPAKNDPRGGAPIVVGKHGVIIKGDKLTGAYK